MKAAPQAARERFRVSVSPSELAWIQAHSVHGRARVLRNLVREAIGLDPLVRPPAPPGFDPRPDSRTVVVTLSRAEALAVLAAATDTGIAAATWIRRLLRYRIACDRVAA